MIKDTSDLFIRSAKMLVLFDLLPSNKTLLNIIKNQKDQIDTDELSDESIDDPDNPELRFNEIVDLSLRDLVNSNSKPGLKAKAFFLKLAKEKKLTEVFNKNPDKRYHNYLVLIRIEDDESITDIKKANGASRYYAEPITEGNTKYLLVNDWTKRDTVAHLNQYLDLLGSGKQ